MNKKQKTKQGEKMITLESLPKQKPTQVGRNLIKSILIEKIISI